MSSVSIQITSHFPPQNNKNLFGLVSQTAGPAAPQKFEDVTISNGIAFVAGGLAATTLTIYDVHNPLVPSYLATKAYLGTYKLQISGSYCYIPSSGGSTLYIVNISNPASPVTVASLAISGSPGSLYNCSVLGNYCYIATQNKGLTVVDVTNSASPLQIFQEGGTLNKSFGMAVKGSIAYTTNYQTTTPWTVRYLKTWNVSNPASPSLLATYSLPAGTKPLGVNVYGSTAFIQDANTNTIQMVDVTDPTHPNYLSSMAASGLFNSGYNARVSQNYCYIPSGSNVTSGGFIDVFDISDPSSPQKIAQTSSQQPGSVFGGISISNGFIFVGDYGNGNNSTLDVFTKPYPLL